MANNEKLLQIRVSSLRIEAEKMAEDAESNIAIRFVDEND